MMKSFSFMGNASQVREGKWYLSGLIIRALGTVPPLEKLDNVHDTQIGKVIISLSAG
jgi:hypothetical protein